MLSKNLPKVREAVKYYVKEHSSIAEIIIVDDASTDDSIQYIENQISKIKNTDQKSETEMLRLLVNTRNLGFSPTVNRGEKEAAGEIIILLNTDVVPEKDFLEPLLTHFKDENVFAVGCMDKSLENGKVVLRGRGEGHFERGFLVHRRGEVNKNNTLWVSGGSGAFRKSIWEKIGGLNELYAPFYWEDIDLSYRALKAGYKVLFEPKSIVVHEHEKGAIKERYSRFRIKTIAYRNQFIFMWSNITDFDLRLKHLLWLWYHFIKALLRGDMAFLIGFVKAFILLPKIKKRASIYRGLFIKLDRNTVNL